MIQLKALQFTYPNRSKPTLQIPELSVQKGEKVFLYGPSGTGKTTLLEILAGVLAPQNGEVLIDNVRLNALSASERDHLRSEKIGFIFQNFNLIPYLTLEENILLPVRLNNKASLFKEKTLLEEIRFITERLGIATLLKEPVTALSVGQQQRVAVARALLAKPSLILADEPTSALDHDHREHFLKLLFELCQVYQITLLFVSHDRSIQNLFDRSISLSEVNQANFGAQ